MATPHDGSSGPVNTFITLVFGGGLFKLWSLYTGWRKDKRENATAEAALQRKASDVEAATKRLLAEHEEQLWKRTQAELTRANDRCERLEKRAEALEENNAALDARVQELESALEMAQGELARKDAQLAAAEAEVRRLVTLTTEQAAVYLQVQEDRNSLKAVVDGYEAELILLRGERARDGASGLGLAPGDMLVVLKDGESTP